MDLGNNKVMPLSPLTLPYSPEFEPRQDPDEGRKTLAEMARITGGIDRTAWDDVFNASRLRDRQVRDLIIPLALMVLLLHIMEIGGRRLLLFARIRVPKRVPPTKVAPPVSDCTGCSARTQTATGRISPVPREGPVAWPNQPVDEKSEKPSPPQLRRGGRDIKKISRSDLCGADGVVLVNSLVGSLQRRCL